MTCLDLKLTKWINTTLSLHTKEAKYETKVFPLLYIAPETFSPSSTHSFAAERAAHVFSSAVRESKSERDEEPRASLAVAGALVT